MYYTKITLDMNQPLPDGKFAPAYVEAEVDYDGPVAEACGAPGGQKELATAQTNFYNTLTSEATQVFGQVSALYNYVLGKVQPIIDKGPNQKGFSDDELSTLNSNAITTVGQNYNKAAKAVNEQIASQGGGNAYIPTGANNQLKQEVATSAAELTSREENQIVMADYQAGNEQYNQAMAALMGAPSLFNPVSGLNNSANGAGTSAGSTWSAIAAEDNSWMGAVGGLLGNMSYTKGGLTV